MSIFMGVNNCGSRSSYATGRVLKSGWSYFRIANLCTACKISAVRHVVICLFVCLFSCLFVCLLSVCSFVCLFVQVSGARIVLFNTFEDSGRQLLCNVCEILLSIVAYSV